MSRLRLIWGVSVTQRNVKKGGRSARSQIVSLRHQSEHKWTSHFHIYHTREIFFSPFNKPSLSLCHCVDSEGGKGWGLGYWQYHLHAHQQALWGEMHRLCRKPRPGGRFLVFCFFWFRYFSCKTCLDIVLQQLSDQLCFFFFVLRHWLEIKLWPSGWWTRRCTLTWAPWFPWRQSSTAACSCTRWSASSLTAWAVKATSTS